jgi:hypothetical protein
LSGGSGSSFPTSASTGQRFWRSDRNLEYFYDGTRWLTSQIFSVSIIPRVAQPYNNANYLADAAIRGISQYNGFYAVGLSASIWQNTTPSASAFVAWNAYAQPNNGGSPVAFFTVTAPNNQGTNAGAWYSFYNSTFDNRVFNSSYGQLEGLCTSNGATGAGQYFCYLTVDIRGIG